MPEINSGVYADRASILNRGLGVITETVSPPHGSVTAFTLVGGAVYAMAVGLRAGDVVTKVGFPCAAAGTGMTLFKLGIYDKAFNRVATTADVKASLTIGVVLEGALTASYTVPADDLYYLAMIGTTGTTMPDGMRANTSSALMSTAINSAKFRGWAQTSQVDLPNPATPSANGTANAWLIAIGTAAL